MPVEPFSHVFATVAATSLAIWLLKRWSTPALEPTPRIHEPVNSGTHALQLALPAGLKNAIHKVRRRRKLPALPDEILLHIFSHLRDSLVFDPMVEYVVYVAASDSRANHTTLPLYSRGLLACALTCRGWTACALEVLHWHTIATDSSHIRALAAGNDSDSYLAQMKHLELPDTWAPMGALTSHQRANNLTMKRLEQELYNAPAQLGMLVTLFGSVRQLTTVTLKSSSKSEFVYIMCAIDMVQPDSLVTLRLIGPGHSDDGSPRPPLGGLYSPDPLRAKWLGRLKTLYIRNVEWSYSASTLRAMQSLSLSALLELSINGSIIASLDDLIRPARNIKTICLSDVTLGGYSMAKPYRSLQSFTPVRVSHGWPAGNTNLRPRDFVNLRHLVMSAPNGNFDWSMIPQSVEVLEVVFSMSGARSVMSRFGDMLGPLGVHTQITLLHRSRSQMLHTARVWDHTATDTHYACIALGALINIHSRLTVPGLIFEMNYVRLPFTEAQIAAAMNPVVPSRNLKRLHDPRVPADVKGWILRHGLSRII